MKSLAKILKSQGGFTLVELMVVLVIIGIIGGVAVHKLTGYTEVAAEQACEANLRAIDTAIVAHMVDNDGNKPKDATDIEVLSKYLGTDITCPSGGVYNIKDGVAVCTGHGAD